MKSTILEFGVAVLLVAGLTATAVAIFPINDDTYTRILELDGGGDAVRANHTDRPLMAAIWGYFADRGTLWSMAAVAHALAWLGLGLVTYGLWIRLRLGPRRYALTATCLALTPLLCQTQLDLLNPVFSGHIGPVLAYAAFLLRPAAGWGRGLAAVALVVAGTLLSEYAIPATAVICILLLAEGWRGSARDLRREAVAAVGLGTAAIATYGVYVTLADTASRTIVHPSAALDLWRLKVLPFRFLTSLWRGSAGGILERLGEFSVNSVPAALSLTVGMVLAVGVFLLWRRRNTEELGDSGDGKPVASGVAVLLLALAVGLTPILLMGRLPEEAFDSRYWLPLLPLTSCLTLALGLLLLRRRGRFLLPLILPLIAGFTLAQAVQGELSQRRMVDRWAETLRPHVDAGGDGLTLAVFHIPFEHDWENLRDFQLTARLTEPWSPEERAAFWAVPSDFEQVTWYGELKGVTVGGVEPPASIDWNLRGYGKQGPIHRVLWVTVARDGSCTVEAWEAP
jgi:hypothetical protein